MKFLYTLLFASLCLLISCDSIKDIIMEMDNKPEKNARIQESVRNCFISYRIDDFDSFEKELRNCFDLNLKPLCDQEKTLVQGLKTTNDRERKKIEKQLSKVEISISNIVKDLYLVAGNLIDQASKDLDTEIRKVSEEEKDERNLMEQKVNLEGLIESLTSELNSVCPLST